MTGIARICRRQMRRRFAGSREMGHGIVMTREASCRRLVMNKDCRLPCNYSVAGVTIICRQKMLVVFTCSVGVVVAGEAITVEIGVIRAAVGRNPGIGGMAVGANRCRFNVASLLWNGRRMGSIVAGLARCSGLAVIKRCRRPGSPRGRVASLAII